jgi:hypothetical protein
MRDFERGNPRLRGIDEWPPRRRSRRRRLKALRASVLVVAVAGIALVFALAILIAPHIIL